MSPVSGRDTSICTSCLAPCFPFNEKVLDFFFHLIKMLKCFFKFVLCKCVHIELLILLLTAIRLYSLPQGLHRGLLVPLSSNLNEAPERLQH